MLSEKSKFIRREILKIAMAEGDGHIASAFSIVEILLALYDHVMTKDDKFILSKGHGSMALYAILEQRGVVMPKFSCHPTIDPKRGIECTTGSLGHGLPMGVGMALAKKLKGEKGRVFVLMGDGECQEGTTWESAMLAAHHNLDNLVAIVDYNSMQALGKTYDILSLSPITHKFRAFNWMTMLVYGHKVSLMTTRLASCADDRPTLLVSGTIKGKGVSYMENVPKWHNRLPNKRELKRAMKELS